MDNKGQQKPVKSTQINMVANLRPEINKQDHLQRDSNSPTKAIQNEVEKDSKPRHHRKRSTVFKHSKTQNMMNYMNLPGLTSQNVKQFQNSIEEQRKSQDLLPKKGKDSSTELLKEAKSIQSHNNLSKSRTFKQQISISDAVEQQLKASSSRDKLSHRKDVADPQQVVRQSQSGSLNEYEKARLDSVLQQLKMKGQEHEAVEEYTRIQTQKDQEVKDETPDFVEGIFYVSQNSLFDNCCCKKLVAKKPDKILVYDRRSLFCLDHETRVRQILVQIAGSPDFENLIILAICLNSFLLAAYDYADRTSEGAHNRRLDQIGNIFTYLFTVECLIKIAAQGFIVHKNSYMRDYWNWLDFIVVLAGVTEMAFGEAAGAIKALRVVRVLRPLRSINAFPAMRKLISSLLASLPSLGNAVLFMFFVFLLFGIIGVQQFGGVFYRRCRYSDQPFNSTKSQQNSSNSSSTSLIWPYIEDLDYLCSPEGIEGQMTCPSDTFCREPLNADIERDIDEPWNQELINFGITNFDNLFWSMVTIFQMITLEGWSPIMYNLMDADITWMAIGFCLLLVIIGAFFLLNVILAVLAEALNKVETLQQVSDEKKRVEIQISVDRKKKQLQKMNNFPQNTSKSQVSIDNQEPAKEIQVEEQASVLQKKNNQIVAQTDLSAIGLKQNADEEQEEDELEIGAFVDRGHHMESQFVNGLKNEGNGLLDNSGKGVQQLDQNQPPHNPLEGINSTIEHNLGSQHHFPSQSAINEENQNGVLILTSAAQNNISADNMKQKGQIEQKKEGKTYKVQLNQVDIVNIEDQGGSVPEEVVKLSPKQNTMPIYQITNPAELSSILDKSDEQLAPPSQLQSESPEKSIIPQLGSFNEAYSPGRDNKIQNQYQNLMPGSVVQYDSLGSVGSSIQNDLPERALNNSLYALCFRICTHFIFTMLITILILANTVVLALDQYPKVQEIEQLAQNLEMFFTWVFIGEMVIKLLGLGVREYARDSFNLFDATIIILSIVDMIVTSTSSGNQSSNSALSAFRGVRLLRVFKLARSWTSFREMLAKIIVTMKDVSTFTILLLISALIFALLGMELFGHKVKFDSNEQVMVDLSDARGESPRPNFDDPTMAFTSVFIGFIGEDWNQQMYSHYRAQGLSAVFFFIVLFVTLNLVLLNLFLAILLQNFETTQEDNAGKDSDQQSLNHILKKLRRKFRYFGYQIEAYFERFRQRETDNEVDLDQQDPFKLINKGEESLQIGMSDDEELSQISEQLSSVQSSKLIESEISDDEGISRKKSSKFEIQVKNVAQSPGGESLPKPRIANKFDRIQEEKNQKKDWNIEPELNSKQRQDQQYFSFRQDKNIDKQKEDKKQNQGSRQRSIDSESQQMQNEDDKNYLSSQRRSSQNSQISIDLSQESKLEKEMEEQLQKNTTQERQETVSKSESKVKKAPKSSSNIIMKNRKKSLRKLQSENQMEVKSTFSRSKAFNVKEKALLKRSVTIKQEMDKIKRKKAMRLSSTEEMTLAKVKKSEIISLDRSNNIKKEIKLEGRALLIFGPENRFRKLCKSIIQLKFYNNLIMALIFLSTVFLAFDTPLMDPKSNMAFFLIQAEYVMTFLFTVECVINIVAFGLLFNGKQSYLKDVFNCMDLTIVITSIFNVFYTGDSELGSVRIFRLFRVTRPLRFLKRNLGLRIQVISLLNSLPGIGNLLVISLLLLMLFGILGVNQYKGKLFYCDTEQISDSSVIDRILTQWDCYDYGGEWKRYHFNFDNVGIAMMTMFAIMTTEGWIDVMWHCVDSTQIHQVPRKNEHQEAILMFVAVLIICSLFILNLFVGVVINTFNVEKDKLSNNNLLTMLQTEYLDVLIKVYQAQPKKGERYEGGALRYACRKIANSKAFDTGIFVIICLNTLTLSLHFYGIQGTTLETILTYLNFVFTAIYFFEMLIKLIAYRLDYFKDGWNVFDFLIVISAFVGIAFDYFFQIDFVSLTTIIRSFRIARVLKIIRKAKGLQKIFQTFINAIPELANVGMLLGLVLYIFSVLGVTIFANVKLQGSLNRHANFQNFGRAFLTLFRMMTGEGWHEIMADAMRLQSYDFRCTTKMQTFEEFERDGVQGCGHPIEALTFFIIFMVLVSFIFLNLFIAIILEGFAQSTQEQDMRVSEEMISNFFEKYQKYDPDATGMIQAQNFELLVLDLVEIEYNYVRKEGTVQEKQTFFGLTKNRPLTLFMKFKRNYETESEELQNTINNQRLQRYLQRSMNEFISSLKIPVYNQFTLYNCHDILNALSQHLFNLSHDSQFKERAQRISHCIACGDELKGFDSIEADSPEYEELELLDQEIFLELNDPEFQKVVNRLENKGMDIDILKLNQMRNLRRKVNTKVRAALDIHEENVFDSSHVIGAIIIKKLFRQKMERNTATLKTRISNLTKRKERLIKNSIDQGSSQEIVEEIENIESRLEQHTSTLQRSITRQQEWERRSKQESLKASQKEEQSVLSQSVDIIPVQNQDSTLEKQITNNDGQPKQEQTSKHESKQNLSFSIEMEEREILPKAQVVDSILNQSQEVDQKISSSLNSLKATLIVNTNENLPLSSQRSTPSIVEDDFKKGKNLINSSNKNSVKQATKGSNFQSNPRHKIDIQRSNTAAHKSNKRNSKGKMRNVREERAKSDDELRMSVDAIKDVLPNRDIVDNSRPSNKPKKETRNQDQSISPNTLNQRMISSAQDFLANSDQQSNSRVIPHIQLKESPKLKAKQVASRRQKSKEYQEKVKNGVISLFKLQESQDSKLKSLQKTYKNSLSKKVSHRAKNKFGDKDNSQDQYSARKQSSQSQISVRNKAMSHLYDSKQQVSGNVQIAPEKQTKDYGFTKSVRQISQQKPPKRVDDQNLAKSLVNFRKTFTSEIVQIGDSKIDPKKWNSPLQIPNLQEKVSQINHQNEKYAQRQGLQAVRKLFHQNDTDYYFENFSSSPAQKFRDQKSPIPMPKATKISVKNKAIQVRNHNRQRHKDNFAAYSEKRSILIDEKKRSQWIQHMQKSSNMFTEVISARKETSNNQRQQTKSTNLLPKQSQNPMFLLQQPSVASKGKNVNSFLKMPKIDQNQLADYSSSEINKRTKKQAMKNRYEKSQQHTPLQSEWLVSDQNQKLAMNGQSQVQVRNTDFQNSPKTQIHLNVRPNRAQQKDSKSADRSSQKLQINQMQRSGNQNSSGGRGEKEEKVKSSASPEKVGQQDRKQKSDVSAREQAILNAYFNGRFNNQKKSQQLQSNSGL